MYSYTSLLPKYSSGSEYLDVQANLESYCHQIFEQKLLFVIYQLVLSRTTPSGSCANLQLLLVEKEPTQKISEYSNVWVEPLTYRTPAERPPHKEVFALIGT